MRASRRGPTSRPIEAHARAPRGLDVHPVGYGIAAMHPDHALNRASWDQLATLHGQDAYYDSAGLIAGASSLMEEEEAALAATLGREIAGRRVLHVQCHLGFDAITFARRGARVTGVDFSSVALERARALAQRCGVEIAWVCADATALPPALDGRFDLAWATIGILCWIADLDAWMRSVARTLAPGGHMVLIDGHPLTDCLRADPLRVIAPYGGGARSVWDSGCDYATPARTGPQVQFEYSLGDVVTAALAAGLRVTGLREHTQISCDLCNDQLRREADGRWRRRIDRYALPVLFTLTARKD